VTDAGLAAALPLPVAVPLAAAVAAPLIGRRSGHLALAVSLSALLVSTAILLAMAPTVFGGRVLVHFMSHAGPSEGQVLGIGFAADPFGLLFALSAAAIGALILTFALSEMAALGRREIGCSPACSSCSTRP
jgi:multicomponent Na+:H+ antiporter subunit D